MNRRGEAEELLDRLYRSTRIMSAAHINLGTTLKELGRRDEAETSYRRALLIRPDYAEAYYNLGNLHVDSGQFSEADTFTGKRLSSSPSCPKPGPHLPALRKMTPADADWLATAEKIVQHALSSRQESRLRYAIGKFCEDVGDFDRAFKNYHRANELKKSLRKGYDRQQWTNTVDRLIRDYSVKRVRQTHAGASASERPLFIVGMPRSGTSLTEQIIASHPSVFGAGELLFWNDAANKFWRPARKTGTMSCCPPWQTSA